MSSTSLFDTLLNRDIFQATKLTLGSQPPLTKSALRTYLAILMRDDSSSKQ